MDAYNRTPIVDGHFTLEKFPGKGGWTFAALPGVKIQPNTPFGWMVVRGFIDTYELKHFKLMPRGNGELFLPVKSLIRKKIGKEAGDQVKVILYSEESKYQAPEEIMNCFENEPKGLRNTFLDLSDSEKKGYIDWILEAGTEATMADRIAEMMQNLEREGR